MIWLPATLLAALLQAWRTAVQQRVRSELSVNAAGLARYFYGLPVGAALLACWMFAADKALPGISVNTLMFAVAAGFSQIIGTNLLLMAFGYRNYVVGTAFAKTEAIQGAILALIFLGEWLTPLSCVGVAIGVAGVLVISTGTTRLRLRDLAQPAALCGLGAGFGFTMTSIFVKAGSLLVESDDKLLIALLMLVLVQASQVVMQGGWVLQREHGEMTKLLKSWRVSCQIGVLAALGSACWFLGFVTAPIALVRSVGQIEVVFTLMFGHFYLKDQLERKEVAGLILVGSGVLVSLVGGL